MFLSNFYKSLYAVFNENHGGICSARAEPTAKISAIGSTPYKSGIACLIELKAYKAFSGKV